MVNTMPLPPAPPEILLVPIDEQDRKAGVRRKDGELHGRSDGHEGDNAPPPPWSKKMVKSNGHYQVPVRYHRQ